MKILNWKKEIKSDELDEVSKCVANGGLIIFPTETVYGIGANATLKDSVDNIFKAKGRANDNPLIVHLADISQIEKYAIIFTAIIEKIYN